MEKVRFSVHRGGVVLGNLWGGGRGYYPAAIIAGEFERGEEITMEAAKMLDTGALDSGMGYESLMGAVLAIEEIERTSEGHTKSIGMDFVPVVPRNLQHTKEGQKLAAEMLEWIEGDGFHYYQDSIK